VSDNQRKQRATQSLAEHPVFRSLPADVIAELIAGAALYYLDAGEELFTTATKANHLLVIIEGAVQIEHPTPGETRGPVVNILAAPNVVGEGQALHGRLWSSTGVAVVPVVAVGIDAGLLERTMVSNPPLSLALYREVTLRFLNNINVRKAEPVRSVEEQLARYVASILSVSPDPTTFTMSQADLGRATGLRRETVNRVISQWGKAGLLKSAVGQLTAVDREKLETIAGGTFVRRLPT